MTWNKSRAPRAPESQVATMMAAGAIFARRTPDQRKHGPRTGGVVEVWRGGVRFMVTRHGLRQAR